MMMLMRINSRLALGALCIGVLILMLFWSHCDQLSRKPVVSTGVGTIPSFEIECSINGEYSIACRSERDEVFVPFSFLHKYFEVYGKTSTNELGVPTFEWSHSYGKIYHPKKKYDPWGTFTTFENYNVEVRERVKCISGIEGVPVSTQWDPKGFFYPTQIAQFGLAHYSKNITELPPKIRILDDGETHLGNWVISKDSTVTREFDSSLHTNVIRFSTSKQYSSQVILKANVTRQEFLLNVDLLLKPNSSMTVTLKNQERDEETVYLHYFASTQLIYTQGDHVYYGVGVDQEWKRLTRDLIIDMQKGWALQYRPKRKSPRNVFRVQSITLTGSGSIDNITISRSSHGAQFFAAADWLLRNQKSDGGWPVPVKRRTAAALAELRPGWHSAMSQCHAISVLSRAYHRSGKMKYLQAAKKALYLLEIPSSDGGVKALWMDKYVWYEEYPTTPPLFVLNGFIYTLLGLYDLHMTEGENTISNAKELYDDGMTSLKTLLPLFDSGSGSFYDLRHFTLGVAPNVARWDYHATHVNQLYLLAGLDDDPILLNTAKRWEGYMKGKRAPHN